VRSSIARAAQATGVNFDYLLAQAKLESRLNPQARAGTSSAAGLYQFIGSTWLDTLDRHGANHGLGWADAAISDGKGGKTADPAMRAQIMALRYDPDTSSLMAAELTKDNQTALRDGLGREPDFPELYLAHFMGSAGALKFISAMQENPDSSAAALFPKQAAANRAVFYDDGGNPRSLSQIMDSFRQRVGQAMSDEGGYMQSTDFAPYMAPGMAQSQAAPSPLGPLAQEFQQAAADHSAQSGRSMMDTLRDTFGGQGGQPDALPDNVKLAYSKLKAYGL